MIELITEANTAGASLFSACRELGISLRTLKRWRCEFKSDRSGEDGRKGSSRQVAHRLSEEERQRILLTCNEAKYASLPPGQIVPDLADQGIYIGSERSFYRVLRPPARMTAFMIEGLEGDYKESKYNSSVEDINIVLCRVNLMQLWVI